MTGDEMAQPAIIPAGPATELDLLTLVVFVAQLVRWLGSGECPRSLVGLVRSAPTGHFVRERAELRGRDTAPITWTLDAIVMHALLPLAGLSLVDGQPVIPELGSALVAVLADPRLGSLARWEVECVLLDSEDLEGELVAEAIGPCELDE